MKSFQNISGTMDARPMPPGGAVHTNNPLFNHNLRSMSAGDYINIHQKQQNRSTSRFSWITPDED